MKKMKMKIREFSFTKENKNRKFHEKNCFLSDGNFRLGLYKYKCIVETEEKKMVHYFSKSIYDSNVHFIWQKLG